MDSKLKTLEELALQLGCADMSAGLNEFSDALCDSVKLVENTNITSKILVLRPADFNDDTRMKLILLGESFRQTSNTYYKIGDYQHAIRGYTYAIECNASNEVMYNNRGLTYMRMHLYPRALADFQFVLEELNRKNLDSWILSAATYKKAGLLKKFKRCIRRAKREIPANAEYIDACAFKLKLGLF